MTEQMIRQEIEVNEQRIISSFSDLTAAARNVGYDGCKAAQSAREIGMKRKKNGYIKFYIIVFILCFLFFMCVFTMFDAKIHKFALSIAGAIFYGSIIISIWATITKPGMKYKETQSRYDSMVDTVEKQREVLDSTLENSRKI